MDESSLRAYFFAGQRQVRRVAGEEEGGPSYSNSALVGFQDFRLSHSHPWIGCKRLIYALGLRDAGREERGSAGKMAATAAGVGRLEEEALRRKERLKALREKTGRKVRNAE